MCQPIAADVQDTQVSEACCREPIKRPNLIVGNGQILEPMELADPRGLLIFDFVKGTILLASSARRERLTCAYWTH